MVLASYPDSVNIEDLAQLADKVVEATVPPVASVSTTTELEGSSWFEVTSPPAAQTAISWLFTKPSSSLTVTGTLLVSC